MTGFGDAAADHDGVHYSVELRSVNNRYFKSSIRLPEELSALESDLEQQLRKRIGRGSVVLTVAWKSFGPLPSARINQANLEHYLEPLDQLRARLGEHKVSLTCDLGTLLGLPGVIESTDSADQVAQGRQVVGELLERSIEKLLAMRQSEGRALVDEFQRQLSQIRDSLGQIAGRAPQVVEEYHQRLRNRVDELLARASLQIGEQDLIREVALFAERSDISEEIQRLGAHLDQFEQKLHETSQDPAGRTLDFITQEMLREANTIASKSADARIGQWVVLIKGAIDRLKEQVQNVE